MAKTAEPVKQATGGGVVKADAAQVPEFMRGVASKGLDQITDTDVEIPRIKLLSGESAEVKTFDEADAGMFWHTIADIPLGGRGKPVQMTILAISKRVLLWRPQDDGGGILARSEDLQTWSMGGNTKHSVKIKNVKEPVIWDTKGSVAESGLLEWGTSIPSDKDSQPAATMMYAMLCAFPGFEDLGPAVVTLSRTSMKPGRKLFGKLRIANAPNFGLVFNMDSWEDVNDAGQKFFNYSFTGAGFVTDETRFKMYKDIHDAVTKTGFKFKETDDDDRPINGDHKAGAAEAEARTGGKI